MFVWGFFFFLAANDLVSFFSTHKAIFSTTGIHFTLLKRDADSLSLKSEIINAFKVNRLFLGPRGSFDCFMQMTAFSTQTSFFKLKKVCPGSSLLWS